MPINNGKPLRENGWSERAKDESHDRQDAGAHDGERTSKKCNGDKKHPVDPFQGTYPRYGLGAESLHGIGRRTCHSLCPYGYDA
jgi:hypothetical protein